MEFSFGEKLKNLREDNDMSQSELGDALQMTQRKISYIENDKCEPSLDDIRRICIFFETSADYFLSLPHYLKSTPEKRS